MNHPVSSILCHGLVSFESKVRIKNAASPQRPMRSPFFIQGLFAQGAVQLAIAPGQHLLGLLIGAGLVSHGATGLASALAGALALAAAAVLQRFPQAGAGNDLNVLHQYPSM
jgi:hypothetical protein